LPVVYQIQFLLTSSDTEDSMNDHEDTNGSKESFREQDIYLPIANVARIMKNAIPQTGKVIFSSPKENLALSSVPSSEWTEDGRATFSGQEAVEIKSIFFRFQKAFSNFCNYRSCSRARRGLSRVLFFKGLLSDVVIMGQTWWQSHINKNFFYGIMS